jgi:flagellar biosynthesis/type III secretory pathway M-ring protein FliF/YscJ
MVEFIRKIRSQLNVLFGDMQPHQKITLVTLGLMVMVPFGMLIFGGKQSGDSPLQWGAAFDVEVLRQAENALHERGYNDFHTVGYRIFAPASKVDEYNGALMAAGISSPHAYDELESALKEMSPFTPQSQFAAQMEVQLAKKLRNNLRAIDGVLDAQVIWSKPEGRSRWDRSGGVKASVHVTPEGGRELPRRLVESLRNSVATMVPDLERENVVVIDRSTGKSWAGNDPDDPFDNKLEELKRSRVQFHQMRIQDALNEIAPNAVVAVNVEFDDIMSTRERSQQIDKGAVELTSIQETEESTSNEGPAAGVPGTASNQPRTLASSSAKQSSTNDKNQKTRSFSVPSMIISETERTPLNEKSLQVAVSIPEGHIEQLVLRAGVPLGTTDQEKVAFQAAVSQEKDTFTAKVKDIVSKMIPPNSPDGSVIVNTYRRIEQELPQVSLPLTDMLKDFISTWGSSIALTLFGLWALMLLKKSMPVSETAPSTGALDRLSETVAAAAAGAAAAEVEAGAAVEAAETRQVTNRDTLEMAVDNDPAAAAAIISKWLQNA